MVWKKQFYSNSSEYLYLEITWNNSLSNYPKYQIQLGPQFRWRSCPRARCSATCASDASGGTVWDGTNVLWLLICFNNLWYHKWYHMLYKPFLFGRLVSMLFEMVRFTPWLSKMGFQSDLMGYKWNTWRFHGIFMGYIPVGVIKHSKLGHPRTN